MTRPRPGPRARRLAFLSALALTLSCGAVGATAPWVYAAAAAAEVPARVMRSLFLDGDSAGDHMVIVGERGHVIVSPDAGRSWSLAETPTRVTLTGVALGRSRRGWAVGHDAVILRTDDGGLTWKSVHSAPEKERPLLDVWFENSEHGIAVGAYGYALETFDGGDTWRERSIAGTDRHLNYIGAAPSGRLYVTAESGRIFRSDDAAKTWTELPSPYPGSFFGALAIDDAGVYVYGLRGHLFYSNDAGATWKGVKTRTQSTLTDGFVLGQGRVGFTGMGGAILTGTDGARVLELDERGDRRDIAGALPAADGALIVFGELGVERIPRERLGSVE